MKALSLTQPWAWSILSAGKRIENLDYDAAVSFMVGRGLARTKHGEGDLPVIPPRLQDAGDEMLPRGVIVGRCNVVGHVAPAPLRAGHAWYFTDPNGEELLHRGERAPEPPPDLDLRWWMGGYALILADVEPLPWVTCRGMLGLWTPPADVLAKIGAAP